MKTIHFTLLAFSLFFISCEKNPVETTSSESKGYEFSVPLDVFDESGENKASVMISSNDETALYHWIENHDLKITFSNDVFDQILDSAPYHQEESSSSELGNNLDLNPSVVAVYVNKIHADNSFNEYSLSVVSKQKESTGTTDKDADLDLIITYILDVVLDKRFHNGKICWNPANETPTVPNSVKYTWRKKWRKYFRVWKNAYSGVVNEDTQCDEFYYHGYRIRNLVTSNYWNFTVSQRKYSDHAWDVFYGE